MIDLLRLVALATLTIGCLTPCSAVWADSVETIKMGDNQFIQFADEDKPIAKVRIPVRIFPFEKVLIYGANGQQRQEFRRLPPLEHTLRARIEQVNHFYIADWHIETIPVSWSSASKVLELDVRLYKRYGKKRELEESVGKLRLKSILQGQNFLYNAQGFAQSRFVNKNGHPIVRLELGRSDLVDHDTIATGKSNKQENDSFSR